MDKKIARRAVLGTAVTGLAALPFVIRSFRQPVGLSDQFVSDTTLAKIAKNSGLTASDVRTALTVYQSECMRWLKFRGLKASVFATLEGSSPATEGKVVSFSESGVLSLQIIEEDNNKGFLPFGGYLRFDSAEGQESSECTKFSDVSKKPVVKGRRTELIDPPQLMELFTTQFALASCYNMATVGMLLEQGVWQLKPQTPAGKISEGFLLSSNDRSKKESAWIHELLFKKGVFSCMKGEMLGGCLYCTTCEEIVNVPFPTLYKSEMNFVSQQTRVEHTFRLRDVELKVV